MENKRTVYANNTLEQERYLLIVAGAAIAVCVIYCKFFATVSLRTFWDYLAFAGCVLLVGGLGFYTSLFGQRNFVSAVTVTLLPVLVFDSVRMWKYSPVIFWIDVAAVALGGGAAAFVTLRRTRRIRRAALRQKVSIGVFSRVLSVLCCVALLATVVLGKVWIKKQQALLWETILYEISADEEDIPDYENSLTKNIGTVAKIDPAGGWPGLSLEEKTEVLCTVVRVECRFFGMKDSAPDLKIVYMDEDKLGEYNHETDEISLSYQYVVDTNASGYSVVRVLCHELYHSYQKYQVDLLAAVRENGDTERFAGLRLLNKAADYEEELENYVSGEDPDSYLRYALQDLEIDADRYADSAVDDYYDKIQQYLSSLEE